MGPVTIHYEDGNMSVKGRPDDVAIAFGGMLAAFIASVAEEAECSAEEATEFIFAHMSAGAKGATVTEISSEKQVSADEMLAFLRSMGWE